MKKLCASLLTAMMRTHSSFSAQKARSFSVTMKTNRKTQQQEEAKSSTKASTNNPFTIKHWQEGPTSLSLDSQLDSLLGNPLDRRQEAKALVIKFMDLSWDLRFNRPSRWTAGRFRNLWWAALQIGTCLKKTTRDMPILPTLCRASTSCLRLLSKDHMSKTSRSEKTCLWKARLMSWMQALEVTTRMFSKKLTTKLLASFQSSHPANDQTPKTPNSRATSNFNSRCLLPSTK